MTFRLMILLCFCSFFLQAQNGTGIQVSGPTSVCPNAIYTYQILVTSENVCFIDVTSTGGHKVTCGVAHNFASGSHPSSDYGFYQSISSSGYPSGTIFNLCIHWVSASTKNLCFQVYDCRGREISTFCYDVYNNSPAMVVQGNTYVCNGQWAYFTATSGLSNYSWSVVPDANETYSYSGGGAVVNIGNLLNSSWHMVSVSATDCWGTTKYGSKSFWTTQCLTDDNEVADSRNEDHQADQLQAETTVLVYPNPVDKGGILLLDTGSPDISIEAYQLFSLDGKLIGSATATALTSIVMPDAAGMYLLVLQDSKGALSRHRVIVAE